MHNCADCLLIWYYIESIRDKNQSCNRNSPSQPSLPQKLSDPLISPFGKIFVDFFQFAGIFL